MGPEALAQVLRPLADLFNPAAYPDLLRGLEAPDDAAVWRLDGSRALVVTADFFPPVVDDPYDFGAIAAANAMSDIWAMGAEPLLALNLVGFPDDLDAAILSEILRGGAEKVREAGAVIAGGHTTTDREPKYGLAVVGLGHPDRILAKAGARPGDLLMLTKPIGTGLVTTAHKRGEADPGDLREAIDWMKRLHRGAAIVLARFPGAVHAATDITGFGLAGHARELAAASGVALRLDWERVPRLAGAERYARGGCVPGGSHRNERYDAPSLELRRELAEWERRVLHDPQTAGGLFVAVAPERADELEGALRAAGEPVWRVGEAVPGAGLIVV